MSEERRKHWMENKMKDQKSGRPVVQQIADLVSQELRLQGKDTLSEDDCVRLRGVQVELEQCWELLRQRRAFRAVGQDPDKAHVRSPEIVER